MSDNKKERELSKERNSTEAKLHELRGEILDEMARKRGWTVYGMDVAYLLFAEKFNWTPQQVRSLTFEELGLFLDTFH